MFGDATIKCQHDGTWTKSPECLKQCDVPVIANSNITNAFATSYSNSSVLDVNCNNNARIQGNSSISCINGTWLDIPTCDVFKCYKPSAVPHASIADTADYLINNSYIVTCDKGYYGDVTAACEMSGIWNITGSCAVRNCSDVPTIPNSKDEYTSTFNYSWNATFIYR